MGKPTFPMFGHKRHWLMAIFPWPHLATFSNSRPNPKFWASQIWGDFGTDPSPAWAAMYRPWSSMIYVGWLRLTHSQSRKPINHMLQDHFYKVRKSGKIGCVFHPTDWTSHKLCYSENPATNQKRCPKHNCRLGWCSVRANLKRKTWWFSKTLSQCQSVWWSSKSPQTPHQKHSFSQTRPANVSPVWIQPVKATSNGATNLLGSCRKEVAIPFSWLVCRKAHQTCHQRTNSWWVEPARPVNQC